MAWPARLWVAGEVVTAALGNAYWRDPLTDLRGGGIAIASQAANDLLYCSSATQLARIAAAASSVLITSAGSVPSLSQTLPTAVQDNITRLGSIATDIVLGGDAYQFKKTYVAGSNVQAIYVLQANAGGSGTGAANSLIRVDNRGSNDSLHIENNGTPKFVVSNAGNVTSGIWNAGAVTSSGSVTLGTDASVLTKTYVAASNVQAIYVLQANAGGSGTYDTALIRLDNRGNNPFVSFDNNGTNKFSVSVDGNTAIAGTLGVSLDVNIAATKKLYLDGGSDTYCVESSSDVLDVYTGGVLAARWNAQQQHVSAVQFGCKVYNDGTQQLINTVAVMTFGAEEFDVGALHSTGANTERITIPTGAGGRWRFSCFVQAACSVGSTVAKVSLRRGGTGKHTMVKNIYNGETQTFAFSIVFNDVVATDYFDLYLESGANTVTFGGAAGANAGYFMAEALN